MVGPFVDDSHFFSGQFEFSIALKLQFKQPFDTQCQLIRWKLYTERC